MDRLEKLRKEIERRLEELNPKKGTFMGRPLRDVNPKTFPRESELERLLSFIDSMQEEPISEDLEKKLKDYVCHEWAGDPIVLVRHFANWQKERLLSKACEYLKDNIWRNLYFVNGEAGFPTAEFIKGFRKAMEE